MKSQQCLTFRLDDLQYGIEAALVQEIFPLPQLTPILEPPTDIIGILNWQGKILPVMHLSLLLGHEWKGCHISDYLIVMQWEGLHIGMVVNQVNELLEIEPELIETASNFETYSNINLSLTAGCVKVDADLIILLATKTLVRQPEAVFNLVWEAETQLNEILNSGNNDNIYSLYFPNATSEEKEIIRQRTDSIKQQNSNSIFAPQLIPIAVITFGNDYFGIDLELVREFSDIRNLTPIPCCPKSIIGNMNLRGEIITLVDIRNVLHLPLAPVSIGSKAVIVTVDDILAGLPVERIFDVMYLSPADIAVLPAKLPFGNEQYLLGTVPFQGKVLKILDLSKIFTQGELTVDEEA